MNTADELKKIVRDKYGEIAILSDVKSCGCGCSSPQDVSNAIITDEYSGLKGYVEDADLKLGCGVPTEHAAIKKGDTVVDLGSGAGNDVFVARALAGTEGRIIGVDMTEEMIKKANRNKEKLKAENVDFYLGEIENLPLPDNTADVVISNCVLNLVPDKVKAFSEVYRILKPGGHFCISDIVIKGDLPEALRKSAEMYAGCVAGALKQEEYLGIIKETGFRNIQIKGSRKTNLPDEELKLYLDDNEIRLFKENKTGIFSITVYADK